MALFLRVDINLIAMLMMFMVFIIAQKRLDQKDKLNKFYMLTLVIVFIQLGIEALTCILNGNDAVEFIVLSNFLHIVLFGIAPVLTSMWYIISQQFITTRKKIENKIKYFLFVPVVINVILSLLSPFFGFYFKIDAQGVYSRGSLFFVAMIITYIYFFISIIHIIRQKDKIILNEILLLIGFNVMPMIGALIQALFYGALLAWSSAAFSLVIVYIYLQERLVHLDIMTGVWTRRSFDHFMDKRLKQKSIEPFGGIFFDIDHLKKINDEYGHAEGDYAITEIVSRIKGLVKSSEIIARLGGDEFIIISDESSIERLKELIKDIQLSLSVFNENSGKNYQLSCSFGCGIYSDEFKSMDQFLRYIDHRMYETKHID